MELVNAISSIHVVAAGAWHLVAAWMLTGAALCYAATRSTR